MSDSQLDPSTPVGLSRRAAFRRLGGVSAAAAVAVVAPLPTAAQVRETVAGRNGVLVRRLFAVLNGGNLDELDAFVAPDHIFHGCGQPDAVVGRTGLKQLLARARQNDPAAPFVLESVVADGEQLAARWTRHLQRFDPDSMEPEATSVTVNGQFLCRIENGQLVETWNIAFPEPVQRM